MTGKRGTDPELFDFKSAKESKQLDGSLEFVAVNL